MNIYRKSRFIIINQLVKEATLKDYFKIHLITFDLSIKNSVNLAISNSTIFLIS